MAVGSTVNRSVEGLVPCVQIASRINEENHIE